MAKHDNSESILDRVARAAETIDAPEPAERLRKIPALMTEGGLAVVRRAITLKMAMLGYVGTDDPQDNGAALQAICGEWLRSESARLSGKGGTS